MAGLEAPTCTASRGSGDSELACQTQYVEHKPIRSCLPLCQNHRQPRSQPTCACGNNRQFTVIKFHASDYEDFWVDLKFNVGSKGRRRSLLETSEANPGRHLMKTMFNRDNKELLNKMNFARNFADDLLLPLGVQKIVYIDTDTIVAKDIVDLWNTKLTVDEFWASPEACTMPVKPKATHYTSKVHVFRRGAPIVAETIKQGDCILNAGVYVMDLYQYREHNVLEKIKDIMAVHKREHLWNEGVHQPSFILALYNHTVRISGTWNQKNVGGGQGLYQEMSDAELSQAALLHWSGYAKPWCCGGNHISLWEPYAMTDTPCCKCWE
mmetsp:Transcript_12702/g.46444  ORF Transcript_12702/g.46444 Transcript_12702/m.46444 type:complete len:324 (-) Transcript_12702:181-1152(-)